MTTPATLILSSHNVTVSLLLSLAYLPTEKSEQAAPISRNQQQILPAHSLSE